MFANSTEDIPNNQKASNQRGSWEIFSSFLAFTDCTEQQIPRPVDKNRRKIFYSGKKKRHTIKNQITVNNRGHILHKIRYKKGRKHDYDVYKKNYTVTPKQVVTVVDLGYLDIERFPRTTICTTI